MKIQEIVEICTGELSLGFAYRYASRISASADGVAHLWETYKRSRTFGLSSKSIEHLQMRSIYILEKIYFENPEIFSLYLKDFFDYLPPKKPFGTSRIYLKIAADVLRRQNDFSINAEELASFCLDIVTDKKSPPAVVIWAVEVLLTLRKNIPFIAEIIPDLTEQLRQIPLPSIQCRVKKWLSDAGPSS